MKNKNIRKEKNNKGVMKPKRNMKKFFILAGIFSILMSSIGYGIWIFLISDDFKVTVDSEGQPLSFSAVFDDVMLDASLSNVSENTSATLTNTDGSFMANATFTVSKDYTDENCTDFQNDCDELFYFKDIEIGQSEVVEITSGPQDFTVTTTCIQNSCPALHNVTLDIVSIGT